MPGRIINSDVQVSYARRIIQSGRTKDRHDSEVLRPVSDNNKSLRQLLGKRRIDDEACRRLRGQRDDRGWIKTRVVVRGTDGERKPSERR